MCKSFSNKRQRGQGLVEYALILALVAVVVIVALAVLGPRIQSIYYEASGAIKCPAQYNAWVKADKPLSGPVYDAMNTCWTQ